jgi:hypothetical protein
MNFPVWKSDSPKEMRKIPVGIRFKDYVAGYINKQYCTVCRTTQPYIQGSSMCLICNTEGLYIEDGSICPKCNKGVIEEDETKRLWF